ncbi:MAG: PorP/SprF family type IX secretion system membrane protein [Pedobacter sp.]
MRKITVMLALLLIGAANNLKAQVDPHFSQYYAYPMWLNPALTGVFNGDWRINANYKNQWGGINNAYQTGALSVDHHPARNVGIGVNVLNQSAGDGGYNYFSAYGSFGYNVTISADGNHQLNFGLQAGIINRSFDQNKMQFGNQFDPTMGYNPNLPSFENFTNTNTTVFDANAGVFYYDGNPYSTINFFGGVSAGHLSRPKDPFNSEADSKIPMRFAIHGGVRIKASESLDLIPHAIYIKQQKAEIKGIGAYSEFKFQNENGLILGGMYRFKDAAIANVGYHLNSMIIGASYDFNTSTLTRATSGRGGIELSISYVFRRKIQQPEPICPRL